MTEEHVLFDMTNMPVSLEQQSVNTLGRIEALLQRLVEAQEPQRVTDEDIAITLNTLDTAVNAKLSLSREEQIAAMVTKGKSAQPAATKGKSWRGK